MKLTKSDRIQFAACLRYQRKQLLIWHHSNRPPRAIIHERNIRCILQALKTQGVRRGEAKDYCQALDNAADRKFYYVILTIGYNTDPVEMRTPAMPYPRAENHYDNLCLSFTHDTSENFYGVALMQVHNPIAIKVEIL